MPLRYHQPRLVRLANTLTHGAGAVLSLLGLAWLTVRSWRSGDAIDFTSAVVFGASLVILYTASALYHGVTERRWKLLFVRFDYAAIFLAIAGTYTAVVLLNVRDIWAWTLLGVVWALCGAGILLVMDWRFPGRYRLAATLVYVGLGWLVLVALKPLLSALSSESMRWLLTGGFFYTSGVIFFLWKRLPYHHAIWHLFVLAGSACHWAAVFSSLPADLP